MPSAVAKEAAAEAAGSTENVTGHLRQKQLTWANWGNLGVCFIYEVNASSAAPHVYLCIPALPSEVASAACLVQMKKLPLSPVYWVSINQ